MRELTWVTCPLCCGKTRLQIREDTILLNFPLYCPKCKQSSLINIEKKNTTVIIEPDAKTQSQN